MWVSDGGGRAGCSGGRRVASEVRRNATRRVIQLSYVDVDERLQRLKLCRPTAPISATFLSLFSLSITNGKCFTSVRLPICPPSPTWSVLPVMVN